MPEEETLRRASEDKRSGKSASTQAGEFVREEFHHVREGKHGAKSPKQAIAIGLSKARRAGVKMKPPARGKTSSKTRKNAIRDLRRGQSSQRGRSKSQTRSRASENTLKRYGRKSASHSAISRQSRSAARSRTSSQRSASAKKASRTKGPAGRSAAARKGARTRARHSSGRAKR